MIFKKGDRVRLIGLGLACFPKKTGIATVVGGSRLFNSAARIVFDGEKTPGRWYEGYLEKVKES